MIEYSIEEYVIKNNQNIQFGELDDFDRVKKVIIESDFDLSDDCGNHFAGMKNLEQFEVLDENSRFYTEDGVLYADITNDPNDKLLSKDIFMDISSKFSGKTLIAFPTNYPHKKYIIPEGTVSICKGAFAETNIEDLTLPSTMEFVALYALEETKNLRVLRVPNKSIVVLDHFKVGKEDDFSIVSSCDSPLNESIIEMWNLVIVPPQIKENDDSRLGLYFQKFEIYSRNIIWPSEEKKNEVLAALSSKKGILSYYHKLKNLDTWSDDDEITMALFFYLIDPCKLHPANDAEAETITDMVFWESVFNEDHLKDRGYSPSDYKQLSLLWDNDRIKFFDYIGVTTIHHLLKWKAISYLASFYAKDNVLALSNLLYVQDATFFHANPDVMLKAAYLGDPVSMWMTAQDIYRQDEDCFHVAVALWHKLYKRETTLPHDHLEDIIWNATNNLKWVMHHSKEEREEMIKS